MPPEGWSQLCHSTFVSATRTAGEVDGFNNWKISAQSATSLQAHFHIRRPPRGLETDCRTVISGLMRTFDGLLHIGWELSSSRMNPVLTSMQIVGNVYGVMLASCEYRLQGGSWRSSKGTWIQFDTRIRFCTPFLWPLSISIMSPFCMTMLGFMSLHFLEAEILHVLQWPP